MTSSFDLWSSLPQTAQPLSRTPPDPKPCFISVLHGLFLCVEGRQLRGHHCGTLFRHLLSDSETHFYLFTVNSYRCSQQFLGTSVNGCLVLASPLGFQDKLPRNCLTLLLGLLSPFCLGSLQELSHQELCRSNTQASASAQASTPCFR